MKTAADGVYERQAVLDHSLAEMESVLVAWSGGVDSSYLAIRAHHVLGARALAVTADSPSLAEEQRRTALDLARRFGIRHCVIATREIANPLYARNDIDRCYHCKGELFATLTRLAATEGCHHVAYGLIADDLGDYRPGQRAASEARVRAPLAEAGLSKADIRVLSRAMDLPTWDRPASPCLASRIPYGTPVTREALRRIEQAEAGVRELGFSEFRVRHFGRSARVEIAPEEMPRLNDANVLAAIRRALQASGYEEVRIDPEGYRRGRLNEEGALSALK